MRPPSEPANGGGDSTMDGKVLEQVEADVDALFTMVRLPNSRQRQPGSLHKAQEHPERKPTAAV